MYRRKKSKTNIVEVDCSEAVSCSCRAQSLSRMHAGLRALHHVGCARPASLFEWSFTAQKRYKQYTMEACTKSDPLPDIDDRIHVELTLCKVGFPRCSAPPHISLVMTSRIRVLVNCLLARVVSLSKGRGRALAGCTIYDRNFTRAFLRIRGHVQQECFESFK